MRILIAAALLAAAPVLAFADETTGTIATVDTARNTLTLTDRTVWMLPAGTVLPQAAVPGDKVRVIYVSNADNGWGSIVRIERIPG